MYNGLEIIIVKPQINTEDNAVNYEYLIVKKKRRIESASALIRKPLKIIDHKKPFINIVLTHTNNTNITRQ